MSLHIGHWAPPSIVDDERSLETDVMRFMALLGFCLMAVFALIQAIPVSQQVGGVGLQTEDLAAKQFAQLRAQLDSLQERVDTAASALLSQAAALARLRDDNLQLRKENTRLLEQQGELDDRLQQVLGEWTTQQQSLKQQASDLRIADQQQRRLQARVAAQRASVTALERGIVELNAALSAALASVQDKSSAAQASDPPALTESADVVDTPVAKVPAKVKAAPLPAAPARTPSSMPAPSTALAKTSAATKTPDVLTMRFASTAAIEQLIRRGATVLYAIVGERAWASTPAGTFVRSEKPARPYQLTESPGRSIITRFRRGSGLVSANSVQWWVTFDSQILQRIAVAVDEHRSGELVIQADGSVRHQARRNGNQQNNQQQYKQLGSRGQP